MSQRPFRFGGFLCWVSITTGAKVGWLVGSEVGTAVEGMIVATTVGTAVGSVNDVKNMIEQ